MPKVHVLDQNTINQIAAGEVIERPSSVVKELTENALDAGATAVTVEIRDGGISLIRITDNGCGIEPDDIRTAFLPHATSKIARAEDLLSVSSLGFRGEALASIASIARVELITKTAENLSGNRYRIEGGQEVQLEEIGAPDGTTMIVRDLFYNTPARRKFLKTPAAEGSYINALMERLALSRPDVSFRLIAGGQTRMHTSGNHNLKDVIYTIYGRNITRSLIPIRGETELVKITGYAGKPEINRGNRSYENYFVNGRYVKSGIITRAAENAYRGFVMQHKYPFLVFHIAIDSEWLDVNVHPAKMELRFRNEEEVYDTVYHAIRSALEGKELIPRHAFEDPSEQDQPTKESEPAERGPEPFESERARSEQARDENSGRKEDTSGSNEDRALTGEDIADVLRETAPFGKGYTAHPGATRIEAEQTSQAVPDHSGSSYHGTKESGIRSPAYIPRELSTIEQIQRNQRNSILSNRKYREESELWPDAAEFQPDAAKSQPDATHAFSPVSNPGNVSRLETPAAQPGNDQSSQADPAEGFYPDPAENSSSENAGITQRSAEEPASSGESPRQMDLFEDRLLTKSTRAEYQLIGQLFETYWLIQYKDQLLVMDQHAAHEKVLFERNVKAFREKEATSQEIQPPLILTLNDREQQVLQEYAEDFTSAGFHIEPFGGREYAVYAVPGNMYSLAQTDVLLEMIDSFADEIAHAETDIFRNKIAMMSCKGAIKGNQRISREEAEALLDELLTLENPYMCPHGRPTIITLSRYELEKKFKRVVD